MSGANPTFVLRTLVLVMGVAVLFLLFERQNGPVVGGSWTESVRNVDGEDSLLVSAVPSSAAKSSGGSSSSSSSSSNVGSVRSSSSGDQRRRVPLIVSKMMTLIEDKAYKKLVEGSLTNDTRKLFSDVLISYEHGKSHVKPSDGSGQGIKYFAGPDAIRAMGKDYIVYGAGNAYDVGFEKDMAKLGANVYSFDCTVTNRPDWTTFTFYPWCVGTKGDFEGNGYSQKANKTDYEFKSLAEIRRQLGHKRIDMLKMDIEGFEWELLQTEIINGKDEDLPEQILVEIHAQGANPAYVPKRLTTGKDNRVLNKLLIDLFRRGYRVQNWELNSGDHACAEFSLIRVPN